MGKRGRYCDTFDISLKESVKSVEALVQKLNIEARASRVLVGQSSLFLSLTHSLSLSLHKNLTSLSPFFFHQIHPTLPTSASHRFGVDEVKVAIFRRIKTAKTEA
jgi:hypothetical protein